MFQAISEAYSKNYLCFPWQLCIGVFSLGFLFFAVDLQGCFIWVSVMVMSLLACAVKDVSSTERIDVRL